MHFRSYTTITLDEETRLYLLLQSHRKAFSNKASIRSLMRKLETRRQKRSKGFKVQLLLRQELQRSNIVVSEDGIIKLPFKNASTRKETIKIEVKPEVPSPSSGITKENRLGFAYSDDPTSRVLDRFQVSLLGYPCLLLLIIISISKMRMNISNTNFRLLRHRIVTHKNSKAAVLEQDCWEEIITTYNVSRVLILAGIFSKVIL